MSLAYHLLPSIYECHCHTPLCKHAIGEPIEYVEAAVNRGLGGIIFTDHVPLPDFCNQRVRMSRDELPLYLDMIQEVSEAGSDDFFVGVGLECDFLPGLESWIEDILGQADFKHIIGSVHPQVPEYVSKYSTGDPFKDQVVYFDLIAQSAESGLYDTLGHCDLIKNEFMDEWDLDAVFPHILEALDRIAATGVAIELNTSGVNKTVPEINPGPRILKAVCERNIPVVLGADAHRPIRVGDGFVMAMDLLKAIGFDAIYRPKGRGRVRIPLKPEPFID